MTSIEDVASRLGRLRFVELRLFEVMGGWVGSTPEPQVKALLAEQCYHHAWHADLWADRFPQGYGHDVAVATAAGGAHVGGWLDELAALEGTVRRAWPASTGWSCPGSPSATGAGGRRQIGFRTGRCYGGWSWSRPTRRRTGSKGSACAPAPAGQLRLGRAGRRPLRPASRRRSSRRFTAHGDLLDGWPSAERRSAGGAPPGGSS